VQCFYNPDVSNANVAAVWFNAGLAGKFVF